MKRSLIPLLAGITTAGFLSASAAQQPPAGRANQPVPPTQAAIDRAAAVIAEARKALGGDKLAKVSTLVFTGRTRQVQGDNLVPIEFEMSCELPDRCVRRDEVPARESAPTRTGFDGDALILLPPPPAPLPAPALQNRLATTKQEFTRLMLGLFAAPITREPLTFAFAGQAEAPQGTADVLDVTGAPGFAARFFVSRDTHLPIMVSWQVPARGGPPTENRLYFADYRDASGLQWPFRIRRAAGSTTTEETTIDRFRVNPRIDAKTFSR